MLILSFHRQLWEHEFPDVSPENFHVVLASNDFLLDAQSIVDYLRECGVQKECITLCQGFQHGCVLCSPLRRAAGADSASLGGQASAHRRLAGHADDLGKPVMMGSTSDGTEEVATIDDCLKATSVMHYLNTLDISCYLQHKPILCHLSNILVGSSLKNSTDAQPDDR